MSMIGSNDKLKQAAAGAAGGAEALAIEDVFSTYLYTGTGTTNTITNGIDLAGEGGLVWFKNRGTVDIHALFDSERPLTDYLRTNGPNPAGTATTNLSFNSNGFSLNNSFGFDNAASNNYASWTFRKAPRFFDVVTFVATSSSNQRVSHNLGVTPGAIFVKATSASESWKVYDKELGRNSLLYLNQTNAAVTATDAWGTSDPTDTDFGVNSSLILTPGYSYVAYLFAHDPLGPSGDGSDGLISCGSFTAGSSVDTYVTLGWEPQYLLVKASSTTGNWRIIDNMRGVPTGTLGGADDATLSANLTDAESLQGIANFTSTGFAVNFGGGNQTYIYIAIRRGPMRQPTSGTEVFAVSNRDGTPPLLQSGFPVDFGIYYSNVTTTRNNIASARLTQGRYLLTNSTQAEAASGSYQFDFNDGYLDAALPASTDAIAHMFRRAPGFFDAVAYTGDRTSGSQVISHNLKAVPELIIAKNRTEAQPWSVYSQAVGNTKTLYLAVTDAAETVNDWNNTSPTETNFTVGDNSRTNNTADRFIAYLFATLPGVSKVGSYTGNGSSQTINCGFTTGARFVLIKRTDSTGDWYVWDTARGIVAANDPHLSLNTSAAQVTTDDSVDPDSSGFIVNQVAATNINVSSASYIYLAIA